MDHMIDVVVRVATEPDIPALTPLVASFRDHLQLAAPTTASIADSLSLLIRSPETLFLVAAEGRNAALLGYSVLRFRYSLWVAAAEAQIDDLFVTPESRRLGLGRRLLNASVATARARGARLLSLATNERNLPALRLYNAAGFAAQRARWDGGRQLWLERDL